MPEVRHFQATNLEIREASATDEIIVTGSPIVYDTPYSVVDIYGQFEERMRAGAAANVVNADVRFLFNHDGLPLARTTSGTLTLEDTPSALVMTATLDARQQIANDLSIAIQRGDVSQMSCGFIVGRDEWSDDMEHRDIFELRDLLDVSSVTYPASPTTSIEVARRMVMEMPIESRARARKFYVDARAGKIMSSSNQEKVLGALHTLHSALSEAGVEINDDSTEEPNAGDEQDIGSADPEVSSSDDGTEGGNGGIPSNDATLGLVDGSGSRHQEDPGEKIRVAPDTAAERRIDSLTFGDQQSAVYQALLGRLGEEADLWVRDLADEWVVYESYDEESPGIYRMNYSLNDEEAIAFDGEPVEVSRVSEWVPTEPVERAANTKTLRMLELELTRRRRIAA
jgi:hypothetical protein